MPAPNLAWYAACLTGYVPELITTKTYLMKQIYTLTLLTLLALTAHSTPGRPVNTVTTWWDNWSKASSWSLNRVPANGDSIVIPAGKAIVFDVANTYSNLYINNLGNLTIQQTMTLNSTSTVMVASGGQINAWGANRSIEIITIGNVNKFDQTNAARYNGYGFANKITGVAPNGFSTNSSLPVTFSSFYATKNGSDVQLSWSTAQEFNNNNFEIQRSTDGSNWTVIALVMGMGTTTTTTRYSYTDKNMTAATVYYRIRQVDMDGKFEYTDVKTIHSNEAAAVAKIYAANNMVNIEFNAATTGTVTARMFNTNGQLVAEQRFQQAQYRITLNTYGKGAGLYVIEVSDSKGWSQTAKLFL